MAKLPDEVFEFQAPSNYKVKELQSKKPQMFSILLIQRDPQSFYTLFTWGITAATAL